MSRKHWYIYYHIQARYDREHGSLNQPHFPRVIASKMETIIRRICFQGCNAQRSHVSRLGKQHMPKGRDVSSLTPRSLRGMLTCMVQKLNHMLQLKLQFRHSPTMSFSKYSSIIDYPPSGQVHGNGTGLRKCAEDGDLSYMRTLVSSIYLSS